jgi:hypothetical protein
MTDAAVTPSSNTSALLDDIVEFIRDHLVVTHAQSASMALWITHTYVYRNFHHTPRLAITAPEKQCGKSTALDLIRELSCCPVKADNVSPASVFRLVAERSRITFLMDEVDTYLGARDDLRGIINSGFERSGSVIRTEQHEKGFRTAEFRTFCPVALAGIGRLPSTIADRSVPISLKRKAPHEKVLRLRQSTSRITLLKENLAAWAQQVDLAAHLDPDMPERLSDRQADISVPLLAIADHAGGRWSAKARAALVELFTASGATEATEGLPSALLADLKAIFTNTPEERLSSHFICQRLREREERPWAELNAGQPITAPQVARMLAPFGIRPRQFRQGDTPVRGYIKMDFEDAWKRYTPDSTMAR